MSESASPQGRYASHPADHTQGPPRKKMRKGTKSCIECRRRKIKCTFEPGRTSICNECFARGSTCIDQEHADVSTYPSSTTNDQSSSLKDRVTQLEDLVKQVLDRLPEKADEQSSPSSEQVDTQAAAEVLKSLRTPMRNQSTAEDTMMLPGGIVGAAPALSLFDNAVISRQEVPVTISRAQYNKSKALISALLQLLPSPEDLEIILENSQEWWAIWRTMFPEITDRRCVTIKESVSHSLRSEKPAEIAKIMLCIALSINQLSQDFDWSKVSIKENPSELMERYISTVDKLIISDDDIAATIDGIECMVLSAKYHINLGRPRRSWLLYHRALAFAQLLGLHRLPQTKPKSPDTEYYRRLMVWSHLIMGDRYLSLVLGLPYSIAEAFSNPALAEAASLATQSAAGEAYLAKMAPLMAKLVDRNQSPSTVSYGTTLSMDQELDQLYRATDQSWWSLERQPGSTIEEHFDRLQAQFFHHQLRMLIHIPFMLRSSTDKRYQYSHTAALESAREMIRYFDALRGAENVGPHICKLLDFQAFTAAMILLLNLCGYNSHIRGTVVHQPDLDQDQQDSVLIDRTITLLRVAANEPGGVVASQCAKALDMLGRIRTGECNHKDAEAKKGTCQISIPYFGTISIGIGQHFVPIKPGTYPEAGNSRKSLAAIALNPQTGLPTPPSMGSHSSQASPSMHSDPARQSPYGTTAEYNHSGLDQSWTAGTEDPFITFDSFMAFPGGPMIDPGSGPDTVSSSSSAFSQQPMPQAFAPFGTAEAQSMAAGFPFPAVSGSNMELDNGWNWFGETQMFPNL